MISIRPQTSSATSGKTSEGRLLPDVLQFMQLLWALVHGLERRSKRMSADLGITGPQRLVLRVVGLVPGVSAGDLAAILHLHPSTLTGVLQRLSAQRLVTRLNHPRDRRRVVLYLTSRGTRVNALSRGTVEASISDALAGVGARDRAATRRVLARLAQHLTPQCTWDEASGGLHDPIKAPRASFVRAHGAPLAPQRAGKRASGTPPLARHHKRSPGLGSANDPAPSGRASAARQQDRRPRSRGRRRQ